LEPRYPGLWLRMLAASYALTEGIGRRAPKFSVSEVKLQEIVLVVTCRFLRYSASA
ncbi:hypothetical protein IQ235_11195, partial [Oscillatoriales cyanobacterium LEGE 11467]|nr:hypothetical protein [Zarconia navalis LEGE 11467]